MRVLLACDHRFIVQGESVYTEDQFGTTTWEKYLEVFDDMIVIGRRHASHKWGGNLYTSSRPGVQFRFIPNLSSLLAQAMQRRRAYQIIRQCVEQVDAVVVRVHSEAGLMAARVALAANVPVAVEMAGCPFDGFWNYGKWQGKVYAPVIAWRTRRMVARAPCTIYVTQNFLQRRYPCHEGHAVACSDVEIPEPSVDVLARRFERIRHPRGPLVFGLIGTLRTKYKGIQTVFKALHVARNKLPPCEFRILGSGDPRPWKSLAMRYGVDAIVHFDGVLPPGDPVFRWLDGIDVYLQPSSKEGLPRALVEAMSRGCPAIASSCAGIVELLSPDCLITPGDAGSLARLLVRAAEDPWRVQHSEGNWRRAHDYTHEILEPRRREFWERFAMCAREAQQREHASGK